MIASLAFRKLCRFVSSFAGNRKLRRAGNNGFVFILRFLRRFEKIKIRCEAQILCLSYLPTAAKSKCWTVANLLRLYYSSTTRKRKWRTPRKKKRNFRSTIFCIAWVPVFDGCRPRSVRHLWATGGCPRKDWSFCRPNLVPLHMFHAFDGSAEAYLCFHEISSKGKTYRGRR